MCNAAAVVIYSTLHAALGGGTDDTAISLPLTVFFLYSLFGVWFTCWWTEGLMGLRPLIDLVKRPVTLCYFILAVHVAALVLLKVPVGVHSVLIVTYFSLALGYAGAFLLLANWKKTSELHWAKRASMSFGISTVWGVMIVLACSLMSLYPFLFYDQNTVAKGGEECDD